MSNLSAAKSQSESEGDTMHGGADPEKVAEGVPKGSNLAKSSVTPAAPYNGSILDLIQEKPDIELNGILMNEDQVSSLSYQCKPFKH